MQPQTTNPDALFFQESMDTFSLSATFSNNKLTITLKDFVDWTIYEKEYTEENIGDEIHKKMDLLDVYSAFSQTQQQCDEENSKENEEERGKLKRYLFGTIVENEKLPCYKIDREGKITVFWNIMEMKTKKLVVFQSKLSLIKVRDMTQTQIYTERSTMEKKYIFGELKKQIEKMKQERQEMAQRTTRLQEENINLKAEVTELKTDLQKLKEEIISKDEFLQDKINEAKHDRAKNIEGIKAELTALMVTKLQELKLQLNQKWSLEGQRSLNKIEEQKIDARGSPVTPVIPSYNPFIKYPKASNESTPVNPSNPFIKRPQTNSGSLKCKGQRVQHVGNNEWTQYIFNLKIAAPSIFNNQNQTIKFQIIETKSRKIMVGIADYQKQKDKTSSYSSNNALCYYGVNGCKFPQGLTEGDGFKQGDIVQLRVNRNSRMIEYLVNDALKATQRCDILADGSREFMAYVEMFDTGDIVCLC